MTHFGTFFGGYGGVERIDFGQFLFFENMLI